MSVENYLSHNPKARQAFLEAQERGRQGLISTQYGVNIGHSEWNNIRFDRGWIPVRVDEIENTPDAVKIKVNEGFLYVRPEGPDSEPLPAASAQGKPRVQP